MEDSIPWITTAEVIGSILLPLPYVLASLAYKKSSSHSASVDDLETRPSSISSSTEWPLVFFLAAMTLVLVGVKGIFGRAKRNLDQGSKFAAGKASTLFQQGKTYSTARRIAERFLTVVLPFYATSNLGAARVALVMLVGLSSNIVAIEDETTDLARIKTWRLLFTHRRWTLGSILLQLISDLVGLTNSISTTKLCLGYLALGLSIFVFSPPFPSSRPKATAASFTPASDATNPAILSIPLETPQKPEGIAVGAYKVSPLICTPRDSELTLLSGMLLGVCSFLSLVFLRLPFNGFSPVLFGWTFLASLAAAVSLSTIEARSLRGNKAVGLAFGSLSSSFFLTQLGSGLWSSFFSQCIFTSISFACTNLDTHAAFSKSFQSGIHQLQHLHSNNSRTSKDVQMSRFSHFVLRNAPNSQLLHSILIEKDSRRILYFMW